MQREEDQPVAFDGEATQAPMALPEPPNRDTPPSTTASASTEASGTKCKRRSSGESGAP